MEGWDFRGEGVSNQQVEGGFLGDFKFGGRGHTSNSSSSRPRRLKRRCR